MFEQAFENLRKATDASIQMQQEMFKKWMGMWPVAPPTGAGMAEPLKLQKKWAETAGEIFKKQRETMEAQFSTGLRNIEEAFRLTEAKDPEEFRAKTIELWQKSFECLRQAFEAQFRDFQAMMTKWTEVVTKGAAQ